MAGSPGEHQQEAYARRIFAARARMMLHDPGVTVTHMAPEAARARKAAFAAQGKAERTSLFDLWLSGYAPMPLAALRKRLNSS